jgi:hypothetical protein
MLLEGEIVFRVADIPHPFRFSRGDVMLLPAAMQNPVLSAEAGAHWLKVSFPS